MIDPMLIAGVKVARRNILRLLHISGEMGANERTLSVALNETGFPATQMEVRRHLTYLEDKGLLKVQQGREHWAATITAAGTDVIEGTVPTPDGIAGV